MRFHLVQIFHLRRGLRRQVQGLSAMVGTQVRPLGTGRYSDVELATLAGLNGQPDMQVPSAHP